MSTILHGNTFINDIDIYDEFGAFLGEQRKGSRENLKSLYSPSATKKQVAVDYRERTGEKYPAVLSVVNEARDVPLTFVIYAETVSDWQQKYESFIALLKSGWLDFNFPAINLELRMFYLSCTSYSPITYLWREGVQAAHFTVKFREPEPKL